MTKDLFERLLYEEESATLEFKGEQYLFARATEDEKSELLKDILGFANAWRRSEAYILIGVKDVRGGRGNVVGIPESQHLDDHSLQQFVNNLTNQPLRFHYEAFGFEGTQAGIIIIEEQTRPVYLKRDYGKLVREKVYVRRGSSTDPTKPAALEEIAQMRTGSGQATAELRIEFAHVERDDSLGTLISWDAEFCEMPAMETIPDLSPPRQGHLSDTILSAIADSYTNRRNRNYFRELAKFEYARRLFSPVRLVVTNVGQVAAMNVRVEVAVPMNIGVLVIDGSELPNPPKRDNDFLSNLALKDVGPAFRRDPGEVTINKNEDRFRVEIDCGSLQPGRRIWSDVFCIGIRASGELSLRGLVFAENLPQPEDFSLTVSAIVKRTRMTVDELCSLPEVLAQEE